MGSVCCGVCWKSSVWMMILVWGQVWGWHDGGAQNSGVILILGLCAVRLYQAPKGKAVGFNPGGKHQGLVPCITRVVGSQGCGQLMVGAAWQEWDHPLQCCKKRRKKKGKNWRKMQIFFKFRSKQGLCLLPLCLLGFTLCFPTPPLLKNKPGAR